MKLLRTTALGLTLGVAGASIASAQDLTIAIVNNGHMINMQKVAEAYTAEAIYFVVHVTKLATCIPVLETQL